MRVELSDEWSRGVVVGAGGFLDSGIVGVWVEDDSDEDGAPSLRLPAADARQMAGALLRAADEADGVKPRKPSAGRDMALSAVWFAYSGQEAEEFADDIVTAIRQDVATFIRANIDMQGLDFPDAESVAAWLEGNR